MFETPTVPEALKRWIREEREYCFSIVPYAQPLQNAWSRAPAMVAEVDTSMASMTPEQQAFIAPVHASMQAQSEGIPVYQGIIDRCLRLVQAADERQGRDPLQRIAVVTLPTNDRYAAIYRPHVAPDWSVIAIDWGFICGLWGLAACVASVAPAMEADDGLNLPLGVDWLEQADDRAVATGREGLINSIIPCILMGTEAPMPTLLADDPMRAALVALLFNGMVFSVVAHEYAHARRGHLAEPQPSIQRRHQMEFEADALALAYALTDPWRHSPTFRDASGVSKMMAVGSQCLVLAFINMLSMGDRMLSDVGHSRHVPDSHPPAPERLQATQYILHQVLALDDGTKQRIDEYRFRFLAVSEGLWNRSVRELVTQLKERARAAGLPGTIHPRGAELRFT